MYLQNVHQKLSYSNCMGAKITIDPTLDKCTFYNGIKQRLLFVNAETLFYLICSGL